MQNFDSAIQSLQMIIKNLEENLADCQRVIETGNHSKYSTLEETKDSLIEIEKDIEEHKEAIIALQMVADGKLRVI